MRFLNGLPHTETLVDGREVEPYGEFELSKEQYETNEQWRRLSDGVFVGASPAAEKVIAEAKENPDKFSEPLPASNEAIEEEAAAMRAEAADNDKKGDPA